MSSDVDCEVASGMFVDPFYWYAHTEEGGCAVGGTFIPDEAGWPQEYQNGFLMADFVFGEIMFLTKTNDGCRECSPPMPDWTNSTFHEWGRPVDLLFGPYLDSMALYYTARAGSKNVRRIRYVGGDNSAPIAVIRSSATEGGVPLVVDLDAFQSSDPDADKITYEWDFKGVAAASTNDSATVTFDAPGTYIVTLTVSDGVFTNIAEVKIRVGSPPVVIMDSPAENTTFAVGDIFTAAGRVFDQDGNELKDAVMSWELRQHHNTHYHPFMTVTEGNNFALPGAPDPEDFLAATNSNLEVLLYVEDESGLSTTISRTLIPKMVPVFMDTSSTGMEVWVDDFPITTPATIVTWKNHVLVLEARNQGDKTFGSWSDGGADRHTVLVSNSDAALSFITTFKDALDPTTTAPTTSAPVTRAPTTSTPTTSAPITSGPVTSAPGAITIDAAAPVAQAPVTTTTTASPISASPSLSWALAWKTSNPTATAVALPSPTPNPTSMAPFKGPKVEPTTMMTARPITAAPITAAPVTNAPTPVTTAAPITAAPTTAAPITPSPVGIANQLPTTPMTAIPSLRPVDVSTTTSPRATISDDDDSHAYRSVSSNSITVALLCLVVATVW